MTATVQTSVIMSKSELGYSNKNRRRFTQNLYQASITDFEGDEYEYEVMADSFEDAAIQLEAIAADNYIQVYNINIYQVG
jgi:hypothetical protein